MARVFPSDGSPRLAAGDSTVLNLLLLFLVAIALTIALLPTYRDYTLREHAKLAKAVLEDAVLRRQGWQSSHPSQRLSSLETLGFPAAAVYVTSDGTVRGSANVNSIYRIGLAQPSAKAVENCGLQIGDGVTGFVLVAEPIQTQRIDKQCATLCLSSSGQRGASGSAGTDQCWGRR